MTEINAYELLEKIEGKHHVILENLIVSGDVIIEDWHIDKKANLTFKKVVFQSNIDISSITKDFFCRFQHCKLNGNLNITNSIIDLSLIYTEVNNEIFIEGPDEGKIALRIINSKFNSNININSCICSSLVILSATKDANSQGSIDLVGVSFDGSITISGFNNIPILINACSFITPARFFGTDKVPATYTSLKLWSVVFQEPVYFDESSFFDLSIRDVHFKKHVSFRKIRLDKEGSQLYFYQTSFENTADFSTIKCEDANFSWCKFLDTANFSNSQFEKLDFSDSVFLKSCNFYSIQLSSANRETYRVIKHEFAKINNRIDSLKFQKREMEAYNKELSYKRNFDDKAILNLNKVSSNYGLSWQRGVVFTVLGCIVFFSVYQFTLLNNPVTFGWKSFQDFLTASNIYLKAFFQFGIPTHPLEFMKEYDPTC